ncbi:MAG: two-component system sensor histidine kinase NtrB, partial [Terriglobales bacterium]
LEVDQVALFLAASEAGDHFALARARRPEAEAADTSFLDEHFRVPGATRLFREPAVGGLGLHYFLPCQCQGRTVAIIGLGKNSAGEFLSGDDLDLVAALAGNVAIAVENARLYATLRRKASEYERLKDFNENIVESIQVGIVATGLDGRVESWNAQMEVLSALPRAAVLGRPLVELLGAGFAHEFGTAAARGGIHSQHKFRMTAGPDAKIVNFAMAPLVTSRFERVGHIVLLSDVTSEVEMEQRLIQADRLRSVGLLAAGVAHEVNTPLAVISSYTQLLAKQTPAGDPRGAVLDTITRQTFRASEIIANLLNFSRMGARSSSGNAGAPLQPVEINRVVHDTLALVEHPLRSAGIHVIAALYPEDIKVMGDGGKLQQVFLNLVLNARDAMPQGGTLRLTTGTDGEAHAWVEVADTGEGIPAELHHRIFDPFFTTKPARNLSHGGASGSSGSSMSTGTGLGLAVTYGIIEEHGGSIQVASEAGRGAVFHIELPRWAPQRTPATAAV